MNEQPWYHQNVSSAARTLLTFFGRRFRFSLKTLLIAMALAALFISSYFAGRQKGFQLGYRNGVNEVTSEWRSQEQLQREARRVFDERSNKEFAEVTRELDLLRYVVKRSNFQIEKEMAALIEEK